MKAKIISISINNLVNKTNFKWIRSRLTIFNPESKGLSTHHHSSFLQKKWQDMNKYPSWIIDQGCVFSSDSMDYEFLILQWVWGYKNIKSPLKSLIWLLFIEKAKILSRTATKASPDEITFLTGTSANTHTPQTTFGELTVSPNNQDLAQRAFC